MTECFKIQILTFEDQKDIFDISKGKSIYCIDCLKPKWCPNPIVIEADPFLFVKDDVLYLFYESKQWRKPGVLKMLSTRDLVNWSEPVIVLEEKFHLSFPNVIEINGETYMIPETSADNSIRLYKAQNADLSQFRLERILLSGNDNDVAVSFCDSDLYFQDGLYYLFTSRELKDGANRQELYISPSLTDPFKIHPSSPIVVSKKFGRNAGSLLEIDGRLYRVSQDCTVRYGDNVNVSLISHLSATEYVEEIIKENVFPQDTEYYKEGGHQLNAVQFHGKWIVSTDAKEYHGMFMPSVLNKLNRIIVK